MRSLQISTSEEGLKVLEASLFLMIIDMKSFIKRCENKHSMNELIENTKNELKEARIILTQVHNHMKMNNIKWECGFCE